MAGDGKKGAGGRDPGRLKTLIKHCALIYFDDIFHISQRCRTSALFHIEVKHRKKVYLQFLKPRLEIRTVRSKLPTTVTEKSRSEQAVETDARVGPRLLALLGDSSTASPADVGQTFIDTSCDGRLGLHKGSSSDSCLTFLLQRHLEIS